MKNELGILGSVSPYSTKYDNCPGYLINLQKTKILLDCGPGVCSKLNIPNDLNNLNIFISHFHKDHYLDIFSIGYASYVYNKLHLLKNKIKVYIPKINKNDEEYQDYLLLKNLREQYFEIIEYDVNSIFTIENVDISFMRNHHSIKTYSTKIIFNNDYKFIYTSDLGYETKDELIKFSKDADILLIESTFVKSDNANSDFHLHAFEAAIIAKEANVKKMILTHFWPEHNKKIYLKEAKTIFKNTEIAKINKKIKIK